MLKNWSFILLIAGLVSLPGCGGGGGGGDDSSEPTAPTADAGPDRNVLAGTLVTLDGGNSSTTSGSLSYRWSFSALPAGSNATLSNETSVNPTFTADVDGAYSLQLIVNNGSLDSSPDTVIITATIPDVAPIAHAGGNQNVTTGTTVTLDGNGSSTSSGSLTYSWSFDMRPGGSSATLANPTAVNPTFTPDVDGSYELRLIVNNGSLDSNPDTVIITATTPNVAPIAHAGGNQNITAGATVMLDGSGSSTTSGSLTYRWSFEALPTGSSAALTDATAVNPTFTADVDGSYRLQLIVNNGSLDSSPDTVIITAATMNVAPIADAGANQNVATGTTVTLDGGGSSTSSGSLSYNWSFDSSPAGSTATLSSATSATPTFTADIGGSYVLRLIVNNGSLDSSPDTVIVSATTTAPIANAGANQNVATGTLVSLDGSGSSTSSGSLSYDWSFDSRPAGSTATLSSTTSVNPTFTADIGGDYVLRLIVNNDVDSSPDTVIITATTTAPIANAGADQNVTTGTLVNLDGSGSATSSGSLSYDWSFDSLPAGSTATLSSATSVTPSFTADVGGSYVLQLVVNNGVDSSPDTVIITATTTAPIANAGANQNVTTGTLVNLDGSGSSTSSGSLSYDWSFDALPAGSTATLSSATSVTPSFTADTAGNYVLQLVVNNGVDSNPDIVTISAVTTNTAPVANAGADRNVTTNATVTLDGSASSDGEAQDLSYLWSITARPSGSTAALSASNTVNPEFSPDESGSYILQLIANDGIVDSSADNVTVTAYTATRVANMSCIPPQPVVTPGAVGTEQAFPNLPAVAAPVAMVQPANDSSFWLIALLGGEVYRFDNTSTASNLVRVLDISGQVVTTGEFGMTGIAIHPDYPTDNRVFIIYNDNPDGITDGGRSVLSSFTINTSTQTIDPSSESIILIQPQPLHFHNGGDLAFGADGMLYAAFGDSEISAEAQELDSLFGAMIRIDVSTPPYTVPTDNPFYAAGLAPCNGSGDARSGNCPEIFAYGFRNPWRFSIDSLTGEIWVGDVGDDTLEEVDRVVAGGNYGWPIYEGTSCMGGSACNTTPDLLEPIIVYGRDLGFSVVGGYVYRGSLSPSLAGQYIFGDVYTGRFFNIAADASPLTTLPAPWIGRSGYGMAQGNDGEVYMLRPDQGATGDNIYRVVGSGGVSIDMATNLSDTGCFDTTTKTSEDGVFDYQVNARFWTDGAEKLRAFALPYGSYISVLADGDYIFPTDTVLIKHFLNNNAFLETRLFINHSVGWRGYSYEWNADQSDAVLLDAGKTKTVGDYTHIYPSRAECNTCHLSAANYSLGLEHAQLNLDGDDPPVNIIDYLNSADYFSTDQNSENEPKLYDLDDSSATAEQRARSYLHSNCSGCHRPGSVFGAIDLRYYTAFANTGTCDVNPSDGDFGISGAKRIAPGAPASSVLLLRMQTLDSGLRMPPLGTLVEDELATQVISDWISGLANCN